MGCCFNSNIDKYRIVKYLGSGSYGKVVEAFYNGKSYAIKVIDTKHSSF